MEEGSAPHEVYERTALEARGYLGEFKELEDESKG